MREASIRLPQPGTRNVAMDAYRGLVMLLMMAEVLRLARVAHAFPGNWFWAFLAYNQTHVDWAGCSLHDIIQPSFSFLVGVALPYSIASRLLKGQTFGVLFAHALWRSLLLIALGIFLRSMHSPQTNFTFEDTLTQIGLGYPFLFLLGFRSPRWQWTALAVILTGYWLAWALYPVPGPGFDYQAVGVPATWQHHYTGFAAHWNKNSNLGAAFDQWFLNLLPRAKPFVANSGGYLTLSFIPTLGTMLLGLSRGPMAARERATHTHAAAVNRRRNWHRFGSAAACKWYLPGGEADLDAELDPLQRWRLFSAAGRVLLADRGKRFSEVGISAGSGGHELHRGLPDRPSLRGLYQQFLPHSSWT